MPNVTVLRSEPVTPPITEVTITLTLEEAQELAGILGEGISLVNGLYSTLSRAESSLVSVTSANRRGRDWAKGRGW